MNKELLDYEIRRNGYTITKICEIIDVSRAAFYKKSKGISEFTRDEIQMLIELLNPEDPMAIFFNQ